MEWENRKSTEDSFRLMEVKEVEKIIAVVECDKGLKGGG